MPPSKRTKEFRYNYNVKRPTIPYHCLTRQFQMNLIRDTLIATGANRTQAARALGLGRTYLLRLIREFEIDVPVPPRTTGSE